MNRGLRPNHNTCLFTLPALTPVDTQNGSLGQRNWVYSDRICHRHRIYLSTNSADRSFARDLYVPVKQSEVPISDFLVNPVRLEHMKRLRSIGELAPGDFSTVKKLVSFYPESELNHHRLVLALEEESRLKKTHAGKRVVGF